MANVLLPLIYGLLTIGKTIDLRDYASMTDYRITSIFNKDDVEETQVNDLKSTYYVLPDEKIPYSKIGLPIDLVLRDKPGRIYRDLTDFSYKVLSTSFDAATILMVTEYRKIEQSVKENATPIPGWQTKNRVIEKHTHYFDKLHYGCRCISTINIRSNVSGDVQIFRRILKDVMGTSGNIGKDVVDLWKRAFKTMKESKEVRGDVYIIHSPICSHVEFPLEVYSNVETLLKYLVDFPTYVKVRDLHGPLHEDPIYVTLKPLRDLDERFDSLEKNVLAERYMMTLKAMYNDLESTYSNLKGFFYRLSSVEDYEKFNAFYSKLRKVQHAVGSLMYGRLSIYEDINKAEFNSVFETYYKGLDNSTENYFTSYKRLYDELGVRCEDKFLRPVKGSLLVEKDEAIEKDNNDLSDCQQECLKDKRCRAVRYSEKSKQCLIYYRSTNSAKILFPQDDSDDENVYDRKCKI